MFLFLLKPVRPALDDELLPFGLAFVAVEDGSDCFLARGVTCGDVKELLGGSRILASELANQGLAGGPREECPNDVGIGDVGQRVSLLGEALDVLVQRLPLLLLVALEIPQVVGMLVHALELPTINFLRSDQFWI